MAALQIVRDEPHRRQTLLERAGRLRQRLAGRGLDVGPSQSQIVPVVLGQPERAMEAMARLRDRGFFVPAIRPPSVPEGQSVLRISLSYGHTDEVVDALVEAMAEIGDKSLSRAE